MLLFSSFEYTQKIFSYIQVQLKKICLLMNTNCLASQILTSIDVDSGPIPFPVSSLNPPLILDTYYIYFIQHYYPL